jgi:hypothetical protein
MWWFAPAYFVATYFFKKDRPRPRENKIGGFIAYLRVGSTLL